jgi:hypothetical protein
MENNQYKGLERRTYFRILYPPAKRPVLRVGENKFQIGDISQGGIRFLNGKDTKLGQRVQGTVTFLHGGAVEVEGTIEWEQDNQFGLLLKSLIPSTMMEKEQRCVILDLTD